MFWVEEQGPGLKWKPLHGSELEMGWPVEQSPHPQCCKAADKKTEGAADRAKLQWEAVSARGKAWKEG